MKIYALALAALMSLCASTTQAAFTATYNFAGAAGDQPSTAGTVTGDPGVSVSVISRGTGITGNAGANSINSTSFGASFDANDYYTFTVLPDASTSLQLSSLSFYTQRSNTGPSTIEVRSSLDGFTASLLTVTSIPTAATLQTLTFSGTAFNNLTAPVTFHIYGYAATGSTGTLRITNSGANPGLVLTGNATPNAGGGAVPEPASVVLVGLGLIGTVVVGRKRIAR